MAKSNTNKVGHILVQGRERGIVEWQNIVDETRSFERPAMWDNLADFSASVARWYRRDIWASMPYNVQVWSEKATVGGVIRPVTEHYGVPFLAVHGFGSATALHDTAAASAADRRHLVILYVGDCDPSGRFMSDVDLPGRLQRYGGEAIISRIALVGADLPELPSFKAKPSDTRYKWYRARFGDDAYELDALDPGILRDRVQSAIEAYIDQDMWERMQIVESAELATVKRVAHALRADSSFPGSPQKNQGCRVSSSISCSPAGEHLAITGNRLYT